MLVEVLKGICSENPVNPISSIPVPVKTTRVWERVRMILIVF